MSRMDRKNIYFGKKLWERLQHISKVTGVSISELIRRATMVFLDKKEAEMRVSAENDLELQDADNPYKM